VDSDDLPTAAGDKKTFRSMTLDGEEIEFSDGFTDLHTLVYQDILNGGGFGTEDARPSIDIVHAIRHATPHAPNENTHPQALAHVK
jgi:UDP-N-acetyl-2-amino-2-deoxyglucuronate dehydrogenase